MSKRGFCALSLALIAQLSLAQTGSEPWPLDAQIAAAARALAPPAPSLRRNIARNIPLSPALQEQLAQMSGSREGDALAVRIHMASTKPAPRRMGERGGEQIGDRIAALGGEVETTVGEVIYASLPANALLRLASMPDVRLIDSQATFTAQATTASVGADSAQARGQSALTRLHDAGIRGKGARVGVLDFSFAGYPAMLAARQVPPVFAQRSFASKQSPTEDERDGLGHGTECARIIHALAPEAELVLASVGDGRDTTEGRVLAAAQWLAAQGANIINFSGSGYVSPLDGSAPLDQLIDQLSRQGSTWIVAAGNQAQLHWQGSIVDANGNGWIDTDAGTGSREYGDLFAIEMARAGSLNVTLNWGPWNGQRNDLDIFLYRAAADGKLVRIAQSDTVQDAGKLPNSSLNNPPPDSSRNASGNSADSSLSSSTRPLEIIQTVLEPGYYFLGVRATRVIAKGTVHLFVSGARRMTPVVEAGSVGSPGTSKTAVTVGAANPASMLAESYSGRGPTADGRRKPELLAAAEVLKTEGVAGFRGTSAATPVVSGLAALLATQTKDASALRERLQQLARPTGAGRTDQSVAWGVLTPELLLTKH